MGELENEAKKRAKYKNLQKIILQTIETAGVLSVALLAPNALRIFKMFGYEIGKREREGISRSRRKLIETGLVAYEGRFLRLTAKGEARLRHLELINYKIKIPKKWDKKWRVIIFDVSEKRRFVRDKLRNTLIAIGFVCLQKSVWVYPYDCEDLITLLKADFKIGKDVLYMIVESIENSKSLSEHFGL
ncbi:MAG: hypothetical protein WCT19_00430 [Candidatus Paceibacterota bacterium]|jgi:DNA-binding transcriptional regulator PaaX